MLDEAEVLKKLLVEEKDVTKEMQELVSDASKYFRIEKPSGRILFQNFGSLGDKQRISIILLGKYFAHRLGLTDNSALSISEISKELGRPMTSLSWAIKELVQKGYVEYLSGRKYRIAYHRIREILNDVLGTARKSGNK